MSVPAKNDVRKGLAAQQAARALDRIEKSVDLLADPSAAWLSSREAQAIQHVARLAGAHRVARRAAGLHLRAYRRLGEILPPAKDAKGGRPRLGTPDGLETTAGGVSFFDDNVLHRARALAAVSPALFAAYLARFGEDAPGDDYPTRAELLRLARRADVEAARSRRATCAPDDPRILVGDFRDRLADLPPASVHLLLTDPPYDRQSLPLYEAISALAARVLVPSGACLVYAPAYALPEVCAHMAPHLRYVWCLALRHGGAHARMHALNLSVAWKPILWWSHGDPSPADPILTDVIDGAGREKDEHDWQQGETEAALPIRHLTRPGDTVLDPCCGSGTVLAAAQRLDRVPLGCEIDPDHARRARARLAS